MKDINDIKIIGVTGSIGSGKSTVSRIMEGFGGVIINADEIAKELMKKGKEAYNSVVMCFGKSVLAPDGEIDRKILGNMVFNDREKLYLLNSLTHEKAGLEIKRKAAEIKRELCLTPYRKGDLRFITLDVPIPVENGFFDISDSIWTVTANDDIRLERIMERNGITQKEAESIMASQMSNREYEEIADIVIINEGDTAELKKTVAAELVNYFGIDIDERY